MTDYYIHKFGKEWQIKKISDFIGFAGLKGTETKIVDSFPTRSQAQKKLHIYNMVAKHRITEQEVREIKEGLR